VTVHVFSFLGSVENKIMAYERENHLVHFGFLGQKSWGFFSEMVQAQRSGGAALLRNVEA